MPLALLAGRSLDSADAGWGASQYIGGVVAAAGPFTLLRSVIMVASDARQDLDRFCRVSSAFSKLYLVEVY